MSARTKARKRAIDAIYAADLRKVSPDQLLSEVAEMVADRQNQAEIFGYAQQIVDGVIAHHEEIDELLETYSQGWTLERMPNVDRAILRVGAWEILFNDEVPDPVAISEAVAAAKELSTDDSGAFINGLLGRISSTRKAL
ncbi:MAG: transcription antitermination factor NusB [Actinomycetales bacterium]|nr:transcription antitermination factor NusB [Actinomycetales bacterium]